MDMSLDMLIYMVFPRFRSILQDPSNIFGSSILPPERIRLNEYFDSPEKQKNPVNHRFYRVLIPFVFKTGGERGIRTPGPVTVNSFQDCRNRPLCHFSNKSCTNRSMRLQI